MGTPSTISEKQLAANRVNAAKSTGPRTDAGKLRSSQNAMKHGLAAENFTVVRLEDPSELTQLHEHLVAAYKPVNSQERFAIERIALAQHSLRRASCLEAGLFTDSFNQTCRPFGNEYFSDHLDHGIKVAPGQCHNLGIAAGLRAIAQQTNSFSLFLRYQAQAERNYQRAIAEFERLKALRSELAHEENGFVPQDLIEDVEEPAAQQNQPLAPDPCTEADDDALLPADLASTLIGQPQGPPSNSAFPEVTAR